MEELSLDWIHNTGRINGKKLLCLVDGEHYPPVIAKTVKALENHGNSICGIVFLGGSEKVRGGDDICSLGNDSWPIFRIEKPGFQFSELASIHEKTQPDTVLDISDDPVVHLPERIHLASIFLSFGASYAGADFIFHPPEQEAILNKPSIGIWGTNKRVGKTAVSIFTARTLKKRSRNPIIVSMGRGGPGEPVVLYPEEKELSPEYLLKKAESGTHAASDYWEDAVIAGVPTIGCGRCGGGVAGNPFASNVRQGAEIANTMKGDIVIMEGSGPTVPPVKTQKNIVTISARIPIEQSIRFFGEYKIRKADLVLITMCELPSADETRIRMIRDAVSSISPSVPIALTVFRPQPLKKLEGSRVFLTMTGEAYSTAGLTEFMENTYGCKIAGISSNLSNRDKLAEDLDKNKENYEILLTELKAAGIDEAARAAYGHGKAVVFMHNQPVLVGGTVENLEEAIIQLTDITKDELQ